jgi:hypothetical protein
MLSGTPIGQPFVCKQVDEHTLTCANWPNNLIEIIKKVINVPCNTPTAPELIFELSQTAASHNLDILLKYQNDLSKALEADGHPVHRFQIIRMQW